jgi:hypothetical protein
MYFEPILNYITMTRQPLIYLCISALCVIFSACHKTDSKPGNSTTTPPPIVGTMNINLTYPGSGAQYELIISEPGGTVLLDTLSVTGNAVIAALKTNDTLVDVTAVVPGSGANYAITCIKSVNASRMTVLSFTYNYTIASGLKTPATTPASIFYDNIPPGILSLATNPAFLFSNFPWNDFNDAQTNPTANSVFIKYGDYVGNYAYFLLPSAGLYNLHMQVNAADTVDCTHMDSAILLTFNRPQQFTLNSLYSTFIGIPDTTDLTKIISFTDISGAPPSRPGVDFEYPKIPVQKYELNTFGTNAGNDEILYYCYADSIPLTIPIFQESDFSISSTQNNNFSVSFPGAQPTYYSTSWSDGSISMIIYAPADSGTQHPLTLLANQNPRLLKGDNFNPFTLTNFGIENFNGMSYGPWLTYITNLAAAKSKLISFDSGMGKTYP